MFSIQARLTLNAYANEIRKHSALYFSTTANVDVARQPIPEYEKPKKRKFTPDDLYNAAMGDSLPTQWDTDALDVFLSLIGNCKEG